MFIIRFKGSESGKPNWVVMKTTLGPLMFGFTAESLANAYVTAAGPAAKLEAVSRDDLLAREPSALDSVSRLLLFPSLEVLKACYRDGEAFHYEDYVVELSPAA
jgi:hypothetical protein